MHSGKPTNYSQKHVLRQLGCLFLSFSLALTPVSGVFAQAVPGGAHQPGMTQAGNGVPVVNINTPNAAGMSHNTYNQFNVQQQGLILNNSTRNAQTQLGGWIQGNPNLPYGGARVILNEVVGNNPSMLRGYIEVGGNRADVIIANPAGISIDGAGFINASGVTLTTGTPQFNTYGSIESYRVGGGNIQIAGQGFDTSGADYTRIIARAVEVNSGIWANDLTVAAGTGTFATDGNPMQLTVEDAAGQPLFAIDVAALGGMYAGKIRLIGTEHGVGVRNAGHIGASAGQVQVTADGRLINSGTINSSGNSAGIQVATTGDINNLGNIYTTGQVNLQSQGHITNNSTIAAQGNTALQAQSITNQNNALIAAGVNTDGSLNNTGSLNLGAVQLTNDGQLLAGNNLQANAAQNIHNTGSLQALGDLQIHSQGNVANTGSVYAANNLEVNAVNLINRNLLAAQGNATITSQTFTNEANALTAAGLNADGTLNNTGNLNLSASGQITNNSDLIAGQQLNIQTQTLDNQKDAQIAAATTQIDATNLTNRGLIDGALTYIQAQNLTNLGTGRIYGDHLAIGADTVTNTAETVNSQTRAGTIAARERLDMGVQALYNNHNAIIYSGGDIVIGGELQNNANGTPLAQGSATLVQNDGATIEATNSISITATDIHNLNSSYQAHDVLQDSEQKFVHILPNGTIVDNEGVYYFKERGSQSYTVERYFRVSSINEARRALGESSHYFMLLPSQNYTESQCLQIYALGGIPKPAFNVFRQPDTATYAPDHRVWQILGVNAPDPIPTDSQGNTCDGVNYCGSSSPEYTQYTTWRTNNLANYQALNTEISRFNLDLDSRKVSMETLREYTQDHYRTEVIASNPGQILAGGNILLTGNTLNDKSRIIAGQTLQTQGNLTNNAAQGQDYLVRNGTEINTIRTASGRDWSAALPFNQRDGATQFSLGVSAFDQNTTPTGTGTQITSRPSGGGHAIGAIQLPTSSLYQINPNANGNYLIETDPRFANYGTWLTSDYMLEALGLDPARTQKRLGDGFYEQQLIREQIGQLTGYRYLAGYTSDEEQYKALMNAGVEFAQEYNLSPGIALTAEQMQQLTSDIVWMVTQDVTLPDGSIQSVLVPQVYTRAGTSLITTDGALLSANNVYITGQEGQASNLTNRATISARQNLIADVGHIQNITTGQMHANDLLLQSATDIDNVGGVISADNSITLVAARDINISSTVAEGYDNSGQRNNIGNTGVVYLSGQSQTQQPATDPDPQTPYTRQSEGTDSHSADGQIRMQAGRDINLHAANIINNAQIAALPENKGEGQQNTDGAGNTSTAVSNTASTNSQSGSTTLVAGGNIHIGTVTTSQSHHAQFDAKNSASQSAITETGSQISSTGDINLVAQNDLTIRASDLESAQGAINANANTINIEAGDASTSNSSSFYGSFSGTLGSKSYERRYANSQEGLLGSNLSAEQINLHSNEDMNITASNVVATNDVNLVSTEGNVTIQSGTGSTHSESYERTRRSGLFSSGMAVTIGNQKTTTTETMDATYAQGSSVGSLEGNVNILAQNGTYTQTGSDVLALQGDINVVAQDITIQEARETQQNTSTYEFKQSGLTIGVSSPLIGAIQTAQQMQDASDRTSNSRMDALAAGAAALNVYNNKDAILGSVDALASGQSPADAGFSLSVSIGSSKASSRSEDVSDSTMGSSLSAGGNINLVATGRPNPTANNEEKPTYTGGNITIQGSNVTAQNNVTLVANDAVNILAASNTSFSTSSDKSSSGSLGVSIGAGIGINASASKSRGSSNGQDRTWTGSHINAGNTTTIISGGDTNIIGSQVAGNTVIANIGGDLNIQSLQDTSIGHSDSKSSSGSIGITIGGPVTGSFNSSKVHANGTYASVNDYAGIMAGDGGFDITVAGNTDLKGAIIASTQEAVDNNRNQLTTGSLTTSDIHNRSDYDAKGSSIGAGISIGGGSITPSMPTAMNGKESGSDSSTTLAGISGGQIIITNEAEQQNRTGQTAEEAIQGINRDVLTGQDSNGLAQNWDTRELVDEMKANMEIGEAFNRELGTFAATKSTELDAAREALKTETDPQKRQELQNFLDSNQMWEVGGIGRLGLTAINAALSGNVSGSSADLLRDSAINVLQGLAASEIKDFINAYAPGNDGLRAALHAITACAGAAAQSADCGSGALGAAGSVVLNNLIDGLNDPNLTESQKNERINLINTIIAGVTELAGGDSAVASAAATIETENNQFGGGSFMGYSPSAMQPIISAEVGVEQQCYAQGGCTAEERETLRRQAGLAPHYDTSPTLVGEVIGGAREVILPITAEDVTTAFDPEAGWGERSIIIVGAVAGPLGDLVSGIRKGADIADAVGDAAKGINRTEDLASTGNKVDVPNNTTGGGISGGQGISNVERYSGDLVRVNVNDPDAIKLAERIGGDPSVRFANDTREFDAISSQYIGQAKPGGIQLGSNLRNQMRATFEAAKATDRSVYYHFNGLPAQDVIDKLNEYSQRYGVRVVIDTNPF
ncbi:MAG: hypothetical protein MESAZ_02481 [Saezia sanguinis]